MCTEDFDGLDSALINETIRAYDLDAAAYGVATADYSQFPGMHDVVLAVVQTLPPGAVVLDAGCGGGRDALFLSNHARKVVALDKSRPLLRILQTRIGDRAIHPIETDLRLMPIRDGVFDAILAAASLLHLPTPQLKATLHELVRVLASGGRLFITMRANGKPGWTIHGPITRRRWENFIPPPAMVSLLGNAGLTEVEWHVNGTGLWYLAAGRKTGVDRDAVES